MKWFQISIRTEVELFLPFQKNKINNKINSNSDFIL